MFSSKAKEPIHGQETTTSRYEHALRQFAAGGVEAVGKPTPTKPTLRPVIVWVDGQAYIKGTEPR